MPGLYALRLTAETGSMWRSEDGTGRLIPELRALRAPSDAIAKWGIRSTSGLRALRDVGVTVPRWKGGAGARLLPFLDAKTSHPFGAGSSMLLHGALFSLLLTQQSVYMPPGGGLQAQQGTAAIDMAAVVSFTLVTDTTGLDSAPPPNPATDETETPPPEVPLRQDAVVAQPTISEPVTANAVETAQEIASSQVSEAAPVAAAVAEAVAAVEPSPSSTNAPAEAASAVAEAEPVSASEALSAAPVASMARAATAEFAATTATIVAANSTAVTVTSAQPTEAANTASPSPGPTPAATPSEPTAVPAEAAISVAQPNVATPVAATDVTEALPDTDPITSVYAAVRPPARPDDRVPDGFESQPAPEPQPDPPSSADPAPAAEQQPAQDGNAPIDARAGEAVATEQGNAPSEGPASEPTQGADSAAAANYPGVVMQRLSRTRRDRVRSEGSAVIAFSIAANGALAALGVAQSSGDPEIDNAGLSLVQRAAPFPAPPAGAMRDFSYRFTTE